MVWKPHVTVATIAERDHRFLLVEERSTGGGLVLNQPAGHLEEGETLIQAVIRETLEESAWHFKPAGLVGFYRWTTPRGRTYLRATFYGALHDHQADRPLDDGILRTLWLSREEIAERGPQLRSPMVLRCVDDYLAGHRYPLSLLHDGLAPLPDAPPQ
ncbi:NUDIX hydrolase [Endothiovibrio diazotrophicus]